MSEIKEGSKVVLISGSPQMTVQEISKDTRDVNKAYCKWFNEQKQAFQEDWIYISALRVVE